MREEQLFTVLSNCFSYSNNFFIFFLIVFLIPIISFSFVYIFSKLNKLFLINFYLKQTYFLILYDGGSIEFQKS